MNDVNKNASIQENNSKMKKEEILRYYVSRPEIIMTNKDIKRFLMFPTLKLGINKKLQAPWSTLEMMANLRKIFRAQGEIHA